MFSKIERELLVRLRSKCHDAKANFRKMNKNDVKCSFGCDEIECQEHIFSNCLPLQSRVSSTDTAEYQNIDSETEKQKSTIVIFMQIEQERKKAKEALLPGGDHARTHAGLFHIDYAAV